MILQKEKYEATFADSLLEIGERLRIIRVQQGFSLDGIAERTKISGAYVSAIESGNAEALPELIYVRGFIRRYALVLNQDESEFELVVHEPKTAFRPWISVPSIQVGALLRKLQYPLYALMVAGVGSVLVYFNNQDFTPTPVQSAIEAPVVGQRPDS